MAPTAYTSSLLLAPRGLIAPRGLKENDTIAIIMIVLFAVLALIGFGIYKLVAMARKDMSVTSGSTSSTGTHSIVDA